MLLPTTLVYLALAAAATAAPTILYDRRQDGELNVSADIDNVVLLIAYPQKMSVPLDILDFLKNHKPTRSNEIQDRADHVMETFVEPSTPYRVEIGSRSAEDGRAAEVVIAGRRPLESDVQSEDSDEIMLLGATEQCGPDRDRDPMTLMCRLRASQPEPPPQPQPQPTVFPILAQPEVVIT